MKTSSLLALATLGATPAFAQTDECSAATNLGTGPTTAFFDTNVAVDTGTLATTSVEQQCTSLSDDIWFRWTSATTGDVTFDTCNNATFDTEIGVWEGSDCASLVPLGCNDDNSGAGCTGLTSLITVPVVAGQEYYVQIGHFSSTSGNVYGTGTLTISDFVDPCAGVSDDSFEPNDTCPAPSAITAGSYTGLFVSDVAPDYYSIVVPSGEILDVDATDTGVDVTVNIFDSGCAQIATGVGDGATYSNLSAAPETVVIEVTWSTFNSGNTCTSYDLDIVLSPDPCANPADDSFEDNDACATPSAITAGSYTGLFVSSADADYYSIVVPAGDELDVAATDTGVDVDFRRYDAACGLIQDFNTDAFNYSNLSGAPETVIFEVYWDPTNTTGSCTSYDLDITLTPDPCANPADDGFEENDSCPTPSAITPGTYSGLFVSSVDADFYSIVLPAGDELDVAAVDTAVDVDLRQFDAACGLVQDFNTDGFVYLNQTGAPETVVFEIYWDPTNATGTCTNYDLTVDVSTPVPPPTCLVPDTFEPNLDCGSAVALDSGTYTGLNVTDVDQDYYSVNVAAGSTLDVTIFFDDEFADVDLYLWDPLINCDTNVAGNNSPDALAIGFSTTDNEDVSYTNLTGATQLIVIEVDMFTAGGCNDYDITITGASDGALGVPFCTPGNPNSTGVPGVAGATGSDSVAANNVTLTASSLPPGQFGIFVTSVTQVPGSAVGEGLLCLGGQIGRYQGLSQIFQADPNGDGSLAIDLTAIPTPSVLVMAMAGETRSFQAWHRDVNMSGPTSNFTEGIAITFTP
ncbi:MAG: hypothetical protein AAFR54_15110 [Planctomycetota bacterium]